MQDPTTGSPSILIACDVEGTFTTGATWEGLRDYLLQHGGRGRYRRFFWRHLPGVLAYRLGLGDRAAFKEKWLYGILMLYAGMTEQEFAAAAEYTAIHSFWERRRHAVAGALQAHLADGSYVVLASGVFQPILDALVAHAAREGLTGLQGLGTPVEVVEGRLTGRTAIPFSVGAAKVERLQAWAGERPLAVAYGDTAADIPLLEASRWPVAVAPDAALRALASERGWEILDA
jgi:phosphoserine phosphatase